MLCDSSGGADRASPEDVSYLAPSSVGSGRLVGSSACRSVWTELRGQGEWMWLDVQQARSQLVFIGKRGRGLSRQPPAGWDSGGNRDALVWTSKSTWF